MVEVDVQFLAGVAVTVFLALMFFGVVVLWDVALALRSVGDKIDKLEDNVDDDLKDIGYALDAISKGTGPGGGTQLHLSGGTISSGPTGAQNAHPHGEQSPQGRADPAGGGVSSASQDRAQAQAHDRARAHDQEHAQQQTAGATADDVASTQTQPPHGEAATAAPGSTEGDVSSSASSPSPESTPNEDETGGESSEDESESTENEPQDLESEQAATDQEWGPESNSDSDSDSNSDSDSDSKSEPEEDPRPRAARNRGRFVTSPDRTPWYATPLDRDAIAAGPAIAGVLEAGPLEDGLDEESEPASAVGGASSSDVGPSSGPAGANGSTDDEPIVAPAAPASSGASEPDESEADSDSTLETDRSPDKSDAETVPDGTEPDDGVEDSRSDVDEDSEDATEPDDDGTLAGETATDDPLEPLADDADADDDSLEATDDEDDPADVESGPGLESEQRSDATFVFDEDATGRETDEAPTEGNAETEDGARRETEDEIDVDQAEDADRRADAVTVDEAVDTMNEGAPDLSLSSHGFDVTADADDDGAVLRFEFDADTVELEGSTKRLLRYQLRSFAAQESTPDAEVRIDGNAIVIELAAADGDAISRWGEGAVGIIDRTLYLSDNSS